MRGLGAGLQRLVSEPLNVSLHLNIEAIELEEVGQKKVKSRRIAEAISQTKEWWSVDTCERLARQS
jgi:hypothetical protein